LTSTDWRRLEDFMMSRGMPRLFYRVEREGAKVVANVANTQSMSVHPSAGSSSAVIASA
jgi:hypothetical protein